MSNEPVTIANAVMAVITAGIGMLVTLGVIHLSADQQNAVLAFSGTVIALINIIFVRPLVTPLANPKDADGNALSVK